MKKSKNMENVRSAGAEKLVVQFHKYVKTKRFVDGIVLLRELVGIPKSGLNTTEIDLENLSNPFYIPTLMHSDFSLRESNVGILALLKDFVAVTPYLKLLVRNYLFFNNFYFEETQSQFLGCESEFCRIYDDKELLKEMGIAEYGDFSDEMSGLFTETVRDRATTYPIVIGINPNAGQNVIIKFLKKNWAEIESNQNKYKKSPKTKYGRTSIRKASERDDFIYNHHKRGVKTPEIITLLRTEFKIYLDEGEVNSIISREKRAREGN